MWKVVKPGVRAELCCSKEVSHVPEEDEVDHPVVLHGGDVDDEVDGVDPPVGGVDDDGVVIRVEEIKLDGNHRHDQDERDGGLGNSRVMMSTGQRS